jgi:hypothetical protein
VVLSREGCIEGCREDRGWKGVIRVSKRYSCVKEGRGGSYNGDVRQKMESRLGQTRRAE